MEQKMQSYLMSPYIALRSWERVPHAYYIRGQRYAKNLTTQEFSLLLQCDGQRALPDSALLQNLLQRGLCIPCQQGAAIGRGCGCTITAISRLSSGKLQASVI